MLRTRTMMLVFVLALAMGFRSCPTVQVPETPCYTAANPGKGAVELMQESLALVKERVPAYYDETIDVGIASDGEEFLAYVRKVDEGTEDERLILRVTQSGLQLCTKEDLGTIILHEFVHVAIWDILEQGITDDTCNTVRHELIANGLVIGDHIAANPYHDVGFCSSASYGI